MSVGPIRESPSEGECAFGILMNKRAVYSVKKGIGLHESEIRGLFFTYLE